MAILSVGFQTMTILWPFIMTVGREAGVQKKMPMSVPN